MVGCGDSGTAGEGAERAHVQRTPALRQVLGYRCRLNVLTMGAGVIAELCAQCRSNTCRGSGGLNEGTSACQESKAGMILSAANAGASLPLEVHKG